MIGVEMHDDGGYACAGYNATRNKKGSGNPTLWLCRKDKDM